MRRRPSIRVSAGVLCVLGGLSILAYLAWEFQGTSWVSHRHQRAVVQQLHSAWPHGRDDASTPWGTAAAIVEIPRFGATYRVPLLEGTTSDVLAAGFGHITGTAGVGQVGNFVIAAHRVTHAQPLRDMPELAVGDHVLIVTRTKTYDYVLDTPGDALRVPFTTTWVTSPRPHNPSGGVQPPASAGAHLLTLTTCAELFHTDDRLVAFGHLVTVRHGDAG